MVVAINWSPDAEIRLFDPVGNFVASAWGYSIAEISGEVLQVEGSYTVLAMAGGGDTTGDYCITLACLSPPCGPPACTCDCQETPDGIVNIADFFAILAQWGQIGTSCDFGVGAPGVGINEFFHLLANWGPCP
ncbi:MAG: hypothetical protein ACYSU7_17095 [Planctomycetota bacterium]|jgi:hypothetical protein